MDNLEKAKSLGIKDAETLTPKQLIKAIEKAEKEVAAAAEKLADLSQKANVLGIDSEGLTADELEAKISDKEAKLAEEQAAHDALLIQGQKLDLLLIHLDIDNYSELSPLELQEILDQKKTAEIETIAEVFAEVEEGKTDASAIGPDGKEYVFDTEAPAAFRYLGQFRTQKEWLDDADAVELMVSAKMPYLILKK